jgi:hypothetical protein
MTLWAWFLGTRVGRGCVVVAALVAAFVATWFVARSKGKAAQKTTDLASAAQDVLQAANVAADTQEAAQEAVQTVREEAAKRPAPDPVTRNDFNNTGEP